MINTEASHLDLEISTNPSLKEEDDLCRKIKDAIVCQHLAPSEKITENVITERFDTTRTVARSLIDQLTVQNFLVSISPRVTRVAPLTVMTIKENFLLRKLLMPELTAMSTRHVNFDVAEKLNQHMTRVKVNKDDDGKILALLRKNREYNLNLVAGLKYDLIFSWAQLLEDMAMRVYWLYVKQHGTLPFSANTHQAALDAMKKDEPDIVRSIIRDILNQNQERVL
ncbi:MAG: FCD domain-containing protein, partial [Pseudomonadota bacterium]